MATSATAPNAVPMATAAPTAVVFATALAEDGAPAALLPWDESGTLLDRLIGQLRSLGIADVRVITRTGAHDAVPGAIRSEDAAADLRYLAELEGNGPLILANGEIITQREALAGLLADPRVQTGVLTTSGKIARPFGYRTKTRRGRIVSASSPFHTTADPNQTFLGVLKVATADRPRLRELAARLAELRAAPPEGWMRELEVCKAGTWKLAVDRITRQAAEREARLAAEAAGETYEEPETDDPEADFEEVVESDPDASYDGGEEPPELERQNPSSVTLEPHDERELALRLGAAGEEVPSLVLTALVRDGAMVGNSFLRSLFWARPLTVGAVERARMEISEHDEETELLRSAVKASDGFFTTFFVSPFSKYVARAGARAGLDPNQVTVFSMVLGVVAAVLFATGERWGLVAGGVVAYFAFFFDCVDGQLARYARKFSKLGAWLDSIFDRSKEYAIIAGLAYGAHRMGYDHAWILACAAMTLQTARHGIDFCYPIPLHAKLLELEHASLEAPGDGFGPNTPLWLRPPPVPKDLRGGPPRPTVPQRAWRLWRRIGRRRQVHWFKKLITFPIGERFAVIAIVTALTTPKTTMIVLLAWGGFAFTYLVCGRVLRVMRADPASRPLARVRGRLEIFRDDGLLALPRPLGVPPVPATLGAVVLIVLGIGLGVEADAAVLALVVAAVALAAAASGEVHAGKMDWIIPPSLRVLEYGAVTWLATLAGDPEAGFAFLAAVSFRQYDLVYRLRHRGTESERTLARLGLGWGGRTVLVALLYLVGGIPAGLYIAAGLLATLWVGDAVRTWMGRGRSLVSSDVVEDEEEEAG